MMGKTGESERKNNNHNSERRGEIGEQMNWTISLQALAEGQALCKRKEAGMEGWKQGQAERKQLWLNGEMGNSGVKKVF